ncbi:MAG TPA: hypothetical protein VJB57_18865 [Dehalococcoidia bacterium]|nr:hypothetical protein [Dehalococcoidia bacterium]
MTEQNEDLAKYMAPYERSRDSDPQFYHSMRFWHRFKKWGWPDWKYNEIIGWIQVWVFETQIRGEGHVVAERKSKFMKKKTFLRVGKVFEFEAAPADSSDNIFTKVVLELEKVPHQRLFKGAYVDLDLFRQVGLYLPWRELVRHSEPVPGFQAI